MRLNANRRTFLRIFRYRNSLPDLLFLIFMNLQNCNKEFLDSRRDDAVVKEREQALQALDLAYFKYREITRNLDEGFQVSS